MPLRLTRPAEPPALALVVFVALLVLAPTLSAGPAWESSDPQVRESVLYGVSCTPHLCVVAGTGATPPEGLGSAGVIVSSRHPSGGASAWKVTMFPRNARLTPRLRDVSCPDEHLCVAVATKGAVLTSRKPMGGRSARKITRFPAGSLRNVSCPSERFCLIAGNRGKFFPSTEPTGASRGRGDPRLFVPSFELAGFRLARIPSLQLAFALPQGRLELPHHISVLQSPSVVDHPA